MKELAQSCSFIVFVWILKTSWMEEKSDCHGLGFAKYIDINWHFSNNRHYINAAKENYIESGEAWVKGVCLLTPPQLFWTRFGGGASQDTCISYTLRRISSTRYLRNVIYLAVSYRVGGPVVKMRYERLELPTPVSALKHRWNNRNSTTPTNSTSSSSDWATKTSISHRGYVYHPTVQNVLVST